MIPPLKEREIRTCRKCHNEIENYCGYHELCLLNRPIHKIRSDVYYNLIFNQGMRQDEAYQKACKDNPCIHNFTLDELIELEEDIQ